MPSYTDNEAWQTTHKNRRENEDEGPKFLREYPSWEALKEKCYKKAEESTSCNWTNGWCIECSRQTGWTLEKERGIKQ